MFDRIKSYLDSLEVLLRKASAILKKRYVRLPLQIFLISFSLYYLYSNFNEYVNLKSQLENIDYLWFAVSYFLTLGAVITGALTWWIILKSFSQPIKLSEGISIHVSSNLAKYLPGFAWQLAGKALLSKQKGLSTETISLAMVVELFQLVLLGVVIAILTLPTRLIDKVNLLIPKNILQLFGGLGIILIIFIVTWKIGLIQKRKSQVLFRLLFSSIAIASIGWMLFGLSYWAIGLAVGHISINDMSLFYFALSFSIVAGLLIIVVPGSFGVREGIMVWLLSPSLGGNTAVIVAVLSRIIVISAELSAFLLVTLIKGLLKQKHQLIESPD